MAEEHRKERRSRVKYKIRELLESVKKSARLIVVGQIERSRGRSVSGKINAVVAASL